MESIRQEKNHNDSKRRRLTHAYEFVVNVNPPIAKLDFGKDSKLPLPVGMILGRVNGIYNFFDNTCIIAPRLGPNGETILCSGNDSRLTSTK